MAGWAARGSDGSDRPTVWVAGLPVPLGDTLPGRGPAHQGFAHDVDDAGRVVGELQVGTARTFRAVLWELVPRRRRDGGRDDRGARPAGRTGVSGGTVDRVVTLLTVGHGTLAQDDLTRLLQGSGVRLVVDVRRFPGSRRHPHVARDALEESLPAAGVAYRWEPRLGGRRAQAADDDVDPWWQVAAFRAYAAHTRTPEFRDAMAELLDEARTPGVVVMCSESVWWRCHRRLISDVGVLLHGAAVRHLAHDGRVGDHPPSPGARVTARGLVYDVAAPSGSDGSASVGRH